MITDKMPKPLYAQIFYEFSEKWLQPIGFSRFAKQSIMLSYPFFIKNYSEKNVGISDLELFKKFHLQKVPTLLF